MSIGLTTWLREDMTEPKEPRVKSPARFVLGAEVLDALRKAGVIPENCRRFILDVQLDSVPVVYTECVGDERLLDGKLAELLAGANKLPAVKIKPEIHRCGLCQSQADVGFGVEGKEGLIRYCAKHFQYWQYWLGKAPFGDSVAETHRKFVETYTRLPLLGITTVKTPRIQDGEQPYPHPPVDELPLLQIGTSIQFVPYCGDGWCAAMQADGRRKAYRVMEQIVDPSSARYAGGCLHRLEPELWVMTNHAGVVVKIARDAFVKLERDSVRDPAEVAKEYADKLRAAGHVLEGDQPCPCQGVQAAIAYQTQDGQEHKEKIGVDFVDHRMPEARIVTDKSKQQTWRDREPLL